VRAPTCWGAPTPRPAGAQGDNSGADDHEEEEEEEEGGRRCFMFQPLEFKEDALKAIASPRLWHLLLGISEEKLGKDELFASQVCLNAFSTVKGGRPPLCRPDGLTGDGSCVDDCSHTMRRCSTAAGWRRATKPSTSR
jgi:hypothetical protein